MNFSINLIKCEYPPHKHKNYEIIVYTKGNGIFHAAEKNISVSSGKIMIIPPGIVHSSTFTDTLERIYINGEFNHIFNLCSPVIISDNSAREGTSLARMLYNNRFSSCEYISSLLNAFTHFLLQSLNTDSEMQLVINDIIDKISNNFYDCNIKLSDLLRKSGYAEDYIRTQFKKHTHKTPTEFLTEVRINHACYLMDIYKNTLSFSEIGEKCGYTDYIYFSRRFKHVMGLSPQKYMKKIGIPV